MPVDVILSFIAGIALTVIVAVVFSFKTKGIFRIALNSCVGGIALILLSVFKVVILPINPLNALIVGIFGIPGLVFIILVTFFA